MKFEGNKCDRVKLLGRVFRKLGKFICQVLQNVGKLPVGLNKIGLKFSQEKTLVTCEKLSHFSPAFFPRKDLL